MATHEQDSTARPGGDSHPGRPGSEQNGVAGASAAGGARAQDDAGEGTFRWPSTGMPRLFGRHTVDVGEADLGASAWASAYVPGTATPPGHVPEPGPVPADMDPGPGQAPHVAPPAADAAPVDAAPEQAAPEQVAPEQVAPEQVAPEQVPLAVEAVEAAPVPTVADGREPPPWLYTETADSLTAGSLLRRRTAPPEPGWRRFLSQATGGRFTPPPSAAQRRRRDLVRRARTPVDGGHHRVAVLSLKGGVGKTTTVMGLGSTLASLRGDRVIALDANPDRGTLSDKFRLETAATVRDLLNERDQIQRYADVRSYTTQAASRLELLASDRDPAISVAFSGEDYGAVARVLEQYYSICITDCGTGLLHSALAGALRLAGQIVVVSTPSVDGARSASATLDWLQVHGYGGLVRDAVVVLSMVRRRSRSKVDIGRLEQHFAGRCRAVVRVPYDPYLEEGAEVEIGQLDGSTVEAYLALAAEVGDGFARPRAAARPSRGAG